MNTSKIVTSKKIYKGILLGVIIAIIVSLIFSLLFTWLIISEKTGEKLIKYSSAITAFIASLIGTAVSIRYAEKKKFILGLIVSVVYFTVLLMNTALFFGGQYQNIVVEMIFVLVGSATACLLPIGKKGQHNPRKKIRPYR